MDSKFIVRFTFTRVVTTFFFFFFFSFSHSSWFLFTVFRFLVSFYFVYSFLLRPSKEKKKEKQPNPIFGYFVNDANRFFFLKNVTARFISPVVNHTNKSGYFAFRYKVE